MKIDFDDIKGMLGLAKLYKPVAEEVVETTMKEYGPILGSIMDNARSYMVNSTDRTIKQFEELGYSREESLLLTINTNASLSEALKNVKISK